MRLDAMNMLTQTKRADYECASDIGSWDNVMTVNTLALLMAHVVMADEIWS